MNQSVIRLRRECIKWLIPVILLLSHSFAQAEYTIRLSQPYADVEDSVADTRGVKSFQIIDASGLEIGGYSGSYALIIGASNYTNGWSTLPNVLDDLDAVEESLKSHGFDVMVVENPNHEELSDAFKEFIHGPAADLDARVLIYFAGHGFSSPNRVGRDIGYLVPTDAPLPERDLKEFRKQALSMFRIEDFAQEIEAQHVLFLFDSCFSGTVFEAMRGVPPTIESNIAKPVRQFITAGRKEQEVPDRSIFRREFVKALYGSADHDDDGYVTGTELGMYLEKEVRDQSSLGQWPQYGKINDPDLREGDFVFRLPEARKAARSQNLKEYELIDQYKSPYDFSALNRVLSLADGLTRYFGSDGPRYKQHAWTARSDAENLAIGIDTSRAIWFLFTRLGLPYNRSDTYVTTARMVGPESLMADEFEQCDPSSLRTGDVLVYRDSTRGDGHTVMVIDPQKRIAWGSHGWDGQPRILPIEPDTGVEYQQIKFKPDWQRWDRRTMKFEECWRYRRFTQEAKELEFWQNAKSSFIDRQR